MPSRLQTLLDRGLDVGDPTHCLMWLVSSPYHHYVSPPQDQAFGSEVDVENDDGCTACGH